MRAWLQVTIRVLRSWVTQLKEILKSIIWDVLGEQIVWGQKKSGETCQEAIAVDQEENKG